MNMSTIGTEKQKVTNCAEELLTQLKAAIQRRLPGIDLGVEVMNWLCWMVLSIELISRGKVRAEILSEINVESLCDNGSRRGLIHKAMDEIKMHYVCFVPQPNIVGALPIRILALFEDGAGTGTHNITPWQFLEVIDRRMMGAIVASAMENKHCSTDACPIPVMLKATVEYQGANENWQLVRKLLFE